MKVKFYLLLILFCFSIFDFSARNQQNYPNELKNEKLFLVCTNLEFNGSDTILLKSLNYSVLNFDSLKTESKIVRRKRLISALLAFPLPFGIIGLHRVYLGSEPYIPIAYVGTLGGAFGILPLIDFIVICRNKDISKFINNKKLMMWVK